VAEEDPPEVGGATEPGCSSDAVDRHVGGAEQRAGVVDALLVDVRGDRHTCVVAERPAEVVRVASVPDPWWWVRR